MNYTKGPWVVDSEEKHAMGGERVFKIVSDRPYGGLIAEASAWWVDTKSAEANARLIAAAPELYEAAKALLAPLDDMDADGVEETRGEQWAALRAAVNKAEGK